MKNMSWAAYGLGVAVVVFALMDGGLGTTGKTLLVVATIFLGALIAAINNVAAAVADRRQDDVVDPEPASGNAFQTPR